MSSFEGILSPTTVSLPGSTNKKPPTNKVGRGEVATDSGSALPALSPQPVADIATKASAKSFESCIVTEYDYELFET
jgi:hypothetical protein